MVDDLLEISRVDTGSAELSLDEVEVGELARQAATAGGAGQVPVDVDPAVAGVRLWVDKRRIERVVTNLVDNAEQYAGGVTRLAVEPGEGGVRFVVADRGPGVAPGERDRIFERFYRGQAAGQRGVTNGTGLGLSLVAEHVRLHGGRVWVETGADGENRFVIELPTGDDSVGSGTPVPDDRGPRRARSRSVTRLRVGVAPRGRSPGGGPGRMRRARRQAPHRPGAPRHPLRPPGTDTGHDPAHHGPVAHRGPGRDLPHRPDRTSRGRGPRRARCRPPTSPPCCEHSLAGPTDAESAAGLQSAVTTQTTVLGANIAGGTATVNLGGTFGQLVGPPQIQAVAQVVFTASALPGVTGVTFELTGQPVDVPVASGALVPVATTAQFAALAP